MNILTYREVRAMVKNKTKGISTSKKVKFNTKWAHRKSLQLGTKGTAINITGCKMNIRYAPGLAIIRRNTSCQIARSRKVK